MKNSICNKESDNSVEEIMEKIEEDIYHSFNNASTVCRNIDNDHYNYFGSFEYSETF